MAIRYSGNTKIVCTYRDRSSDYKCVISVNGRHCCTEYVGTPRLLTHAVDSPIAYDSTARAAISFAMSDGKLDDSDVEYNTHGIEVTRIKRRR